MPPRPRRLVLLGHPVAHSLSPRFQQAALDAAGIPLRYELQDVAAADLTRVVEQLRREGAAGNVTLPHKPAMLALCDAVTPLAQRVGAVNTFWTDAEGRLQGDNTDVGGFAAAVAALLGQPLTEQRVLVLGAGGAALAVREAVADAPGATLSVLARNTEAAARFIAPLGARGRVLRDADAANVARQVDLVVNATPIGLSGHDGLPIAPELLAEGAAVLDLTYRGDGPTPWVTACRARGLRADDGLRMLVEQGALAFERWFGIPAPRALMLAAVGR